MIFSSIRSRIRTSIAPCAVVLAFACVASVSAVDAGCGGKQIGDGSESDPDRGGDRGGEGRGTEPSCACTCYSRSGPSYNCGYSSTCC